MIRDNWIVEDKGFGQGLLLTDEQVAVANDNSNEQELILDSSLLDSVLDDNSQQTTLTVERQRKWDTIGAEINGGFR